MLHAVSADGAVHGKPLSACPADLSYTSIRFVGHPDCFRLSILKSAVRTGKHGFPGHRKDLKESEK